MRKYIFTYFLGCKGLPLLVVLQVSNDDVGVARDVVFRGIRPGARFQKSWGGYRITILHLYLYQVNFFLNDESS